MYCTNCGNWIPDGDTFCTRCGARVKEMGSVAQQDVTPEDGRSAYIDTGYLPDAKPSTGRSPFRRPLGTAAASQGAARQATPLGGLPMSRRTAIAIGASIGGVAAGVVIAALSHSWFGLAQEQDSSSPDGADDDADDVSATQGDDGEEGGSSSAEDASENDSSDAAAEEEDDADKVTVRDSVEAYSWEELGALALQMGAMGTEANALSLAQEYHLCGANGTLDGTQTKSVTLTTGAVVTFQIAGFCHDVRSDGNGMAGITFVAQDAVDDRVMNGYDTNVGGWASSALRGWLNSTFYGELPAELQGLVLTVDKYANNTGVASDPTVVNATQDNVWLLASCEVAGRATDWFSGSQYYVNGVLNPEGTQYKLYSDMGVVVDGSNSILVKRWGGSASRWWLRTVVPYDSNAFFDVHENGDPDYVAYTATPHTVVPCFCI